MVVSGTLGGSERTGVTGAFVSLPLLIAATVWHDRFRCPACAELFFRRLLYGNPFTTKCLNCGCRIGSAADHRTTPL
jgi:hypothetical protein